MDTICRLGRSGEIARKIAAAKQTVARASVSSDRSVISDDRESLTDSARVRWNFPRPGIFARASRSNQRFWDRRAYFSRASWSPYVTSRKKKKKQTNWTNEHLSKFERECLRLYNNHLCNNRDTCVACNERWRRLEALVKRIRPPH